MYGEVVRTAAYLLNMVPIKGVEKTPLEAC